MYFYLDSQDSQCTKGILNDIAKTINDTFAGWKGLWYFWVFLWFFTRKTPENLKKYSVSIIVSFFVKKFHFLLFVTCFLLFTREKKICPWTLWNFLRPTASRNFKIGFTCKFSSPSLTGENRALTVDEIFSTQKRDNYTNKVLLVDFAGGIVNQIANFHANFTTILKPLKGASYIQKLFFWPRDYHIKES